MSPDPFRKNSGYLGRFTFSFDKPNVRLAVRFTVAVLLFVQFVAFEVSLWFTDLYLAVAQFLSFVLFLVGFYLLTNKGELE